MLIFPAFAQATGGGGLTGGLMQFLPLILIFGVFYILMIRPQQKRMKEHKAKLAAIRRGDRILTGGGMIGTVAKAGDDQLSVDLTDSVQVKVMRSTVADVLAKTDPAKGSKALKDEAKNETAGDHGGNDGEDTAAAGGKTAGPEDPPPKKGLLSKK